MQNDGWTIAWQNFADDDGSLPGIEFSSLNAESVRTIFEHFRTSGGILNQGAHLYDKSLQADVLIETLSDPAGKVTTGSGYAFHCVFSDVLHCGVQLPELGLFVCEDCITVDYQMGPHWHRSNVNAFFEYLAHLKSLAPEAIVSLEEPEGPPFPEKFMAALSLYFSQAQV